MTTLAPLTPDHFETVARWLSTPAINCWLSGDWRDKETTATVVAIAVRNRKNRLFLVTHDGEPCGMVALSDIETADKTAMIWYLMGEQSLSGKGVMSEAVRQLVDKAFTQMDFRSLYAWAMENNAASIKVLHKSGFCKVGRIRHSACWAGGQVDRIYFDLIPADLAPPSGSVL